MSVDFRPPIRNIGTVSKREAAKRARALSSAIGGVESTVWPLENVAYALEMAFDQLAAVDIGESSETDLIVRRRAVRAIDRALESLPATRRLLRQMRPILADGIELDPPDPPEQRDQVCARCGGLFPITRSDARYCSARCRVAAKRLRDRSAA